LQWINGFLARAVLFSVINQQANGQENCLSAKNAQKQDVVGKQNVK
jgi:hypothetical protein